MIDKMQYLDTWGYCLILIRFKVSEYINWVDKVERTYNDSK